MDPYKGASEGGHFQVDSAQMQVSERKSPCSIVLNVLQGLWNVIERRRRDQAYVYSVYHTRLGSGGAGQIDFARRSMLFLNINDMRNSKPSDKLYKILIRIQR